MAMLGITANTRYRIIIIIIRGVLLPALHTCPGMHYKYTQAKVRTSLKRGEFNPIYSQIKLTIRDTITL